MKAVILCGGKGTRLNEETAFIPKPLVKIGEIPILLHIMKIYSSHGIKDFLIPLGYKGDLIKEYFLNYHELSHNFTLSFKNNKREIIFESPVSLDDWTITFIETGLETQTGGRLAQLERYLKDEEDFFLTYGDTLSDIDISALYKFHKTNGKKLTLSGVSSVSPYGILEIENNGVKSFREKPKLEGFVNGGFFVCNNSVFKHLINNENCVFEEEPIREIVKENQLSVYKHYGFWKCMDTYKQVLELNKIWNTGKAPWIISGKVVEGK